MKGGKSTVATRKADNKLAVKKNGRAAKVPNKPKRPANAFFVFMEEFRRHFKEENPGNKSVAAIGKAGGTKWKEMSDSEKAPYVAKANKMRKKYEKILTSYNKKEVGDGNEESVDSSSDILSMNNSGDGDELDHSEIHFLESNTTRKRKAETQKTRCYLKRRMTNIISSYELKADMVLQALSIRNKTSFPKSVPTIKECMKVLQDWPGFEQGTSKYQDALINLMDSSAREAFMVFTERMDKIHSVLQLIARGRTYDDDYEDRMKHWMEEERIRILLCCLAVEGIVILHYMNKI